MPDVSDLDKIQSAAWMVHNTAESLIRWLDNVRLGNSISKGGVRGHMEDIEEYIQNVYEILEDW